MFQFDTTINLGNALTVLTVCVAVWRWTVTQSRRDQKMDLVLFGDEAMGVPGLVKDVHVLKDDTEDIFEHLRGLGPQFALNRREAERRRAQERRN